MSTPADWKRIEELAEKATRLPYLDNEQVIKKLIGGFAKLIRACETSGRIIGYDSTALDEAREVLALLTGEEGEGK